MKWIDNLRQIYEQQIWDPSYDVLDCDIHIHFAVYLKEILEPRLLFEDNKIMLDKKRNHKYLSFLLFPDQSIKRII